MIRIPKNKKQTSPEMTDDTSEPRSERLIPKGKPTADGTFNEVDLADGSLDGTFSGDEARISVKKEDPALSSAYRILQSGANSCKMLRDKLEKKGFSKAEADRVIALCKSQGLLHEKRLFFAYTEQLARKKHYGKSRIRRELLLKFDRQTVDEYFSEAIEEIDFREYAKEEARRVAHRGKRYVISRLNTLGYSSSDIYASLDGLSFETESFDT